MLILYVNNFISSSTKNDAITKKKLTCETCFDEYISERELKNHIKAHTKNIFFNV